MFRRRDFRELEEVAGERGSTGERSEGEDDDLSGVRAGKICLLGLKKSDFGNEMVLLLGSLVVTVAAGELQVRAAIVESLGDPILEC